MRQENEIPLSSSGALDGAQPDLVAEYAQQARIIHTILSSVSDFAYTFDHSGSFVYANKALTDLLGLAPHDIIGKTFFDLPYPKELATKLQAQIQQVFDTRRPLSDRTPYTSPSGLSGYYEYIFSPVLGTDGSVERVAGTTRNITDLQLSLEALQHSEENFRQLADAMPQIVWAARPDGTVDYYNRRWFEYIDNAAPTAEDVRWDRYIHPDDLPRAYDMWSAALRSGDPYTIEFRVRRADGQYRWFLVRALAIRNGAAQITRWFGTCTDLHDQKQAEEALRFSREQMTLVVRGANVGVWYCPLPFDELIWDEKTKEHFHLPSEAAVTIDTFYERLHPADRDRTRQAIAASIDQRQTYDIDYRTVSPDGQHTKWIRAIGRGFYDLAGNPIRFDGITIDETARKIAEAQQRETESRYADILRTSLDAIISINELGIVTDWNPACAATFGYSREEALGKEMAELIIPPGLRGMHRKGLAHFLATGEGPILNKRLEIKAMVKGGAELPVELTVTVASLSNPPTFTAFIRDISHRRQIEAEREALLESERAARSEAERASRMKDEFLATLSHELRTPLNAIFGWTQLLKRATDPEMIAEGVEVIDRNVRIQTQLIEDLLDMSRIISGKLRLDVQRVDLGKCITAAIETVAPAAQAKGIGIIKIMDPAAGPISGDPGRIQQIIWNLLSNAIKFTPKEGRVQVLLERVDSHLAITVVDSGIGIDPEFIPYVFDRFRQADAATNRKHGGLGLGLAIVKQLVEQHGGTIRASSNGVGHGTAFIIHLPLKVVHPHDDAAEQKHGNGHAQEKDACQSANLAGLKILIVDDERDARELLRRVLEDCHAHVTTAPSAAQALALIPANHPDILVSDIGMPGVDGYQFLRQLRAMSPADGGKTPAIALTAFARSEDRTRAMLAGFVAHVAKPVEPTELIATIAAITGRTSQ